MACGFAYLAPDGHYQNSGHVADLLKRLSEIAQHATLHSGEALVTIEEQLVVDLDRGRFADGYYTAFFRENYEARARHAIQCEIEALMES